MADLTWIIFIWEEDSIVPPTRQYRAVWAQHSEVWLIAMW